MQQYKGFFDKFVLIVNVIVYRLDALLGNLIDTLFILTYRIVVSKPLGPLNDIGNICIYYVVLTAIILHVVYSVAYMINDVIDYNFSRLSKTNIDYSFYHLRPIYYFRCSRVIVIYMFSLYILLVSMILLLVPQILPLTLFFIVILTLLTVAHSLNDNILRSITFYLMRFSKYTYALILFDIIFLNKLYNDVILFVVLSLVVPYLMYSTVGYSRLKMLRTKDQLIIIILYAITIFSLTIVYPLEVVLFDKPLLSLVNAFIIGYLSIVLPLLAIKQLLRRLIGASNPTFYHHLLRLSLGAILTLLITSSIFFILF